MLKSDCKWSRSRITSKDGLEFLTSTTPGKLVVKNQHTNQLVVKTLYFGGSLRGFFGRYYALRKDSRPKLKLDDPFFLALGISYLHYLAYKGDSKEMSEYLNIYKGIFTKDINGRTPIEVALLKKPPQLCYAASRPYEKAPKQAYSSFRQDSGPTAPSRSYQ